jgi:hypothetical protein
MKALTELALSVGVRPAGEGQLLEHFPPGELSDDHRTLRWPSVRITRGGCRGTYPGLTDARCQTSDGLCELAELAGYESAGADCVNVGEQRTGVLFYRSGPAQATLPLTVTRDAEDVVQVAHAGAPDSARVSGLGDAHRPRRRSDPDARARGAARGPGARAGGASPW